MASTGTPPATKKKAASTKARSGDGSRALRRIDESFEEWHYEPTASGSAYAGAVVMSLAALALGAGSYAAVVIKTGTWHDNALWLIAVGVALFAIFVMLPTKKARALRVGELGVGFEEDGKPVRSAWWEITRVSLVDRVMTLDTTKGPIVIALDTHGAAAARIGCEALLRIPKRVELEDDDVAGLGKPAGGARVAAEPPQVTQAKCRASDEPLTFEKDVRMCSRCGALYHRNGVPRRCAECGKKLKAA